LGETAKDPDVPDGEKPFPVPLQEVAWVLVQTSVDDSLLGIEVGDADNVTVGRAWLNACPAISSGDISKPSPVVVSSVLRNISVPSLNLGLELRGIQNGRPTPVDQVSAGRNI
jgi:hypothetical protein